MKILIAGDWHSELHEEVVAKSLRAMGHTVSEFKWHPYFRSIAEKKGFLTDLWQRFQNKYLVGPAIDQVNDDLLRSVEAFGPNMVLIYRGTHVRRETLQRAQAIKPDCVFVSYNNDDPFSPSQPAYLWRYFIDALPEYDLVLAYRDVNLSEYREAGAKRVELLRSWFVPERNHPVVLSAEQTRQFGTDVVFVGHYEPDQRLMYLENLVQSGIGFRLFGPGYDWDPVLKNSAALREQMPVRLVWGEEYNLALAGAKIALCFMSKLNRDTYTRRCFEIPASGTLLLSEYSDDLASMFIEGMEADYFRSPEEMIEKVRRYLADDTLRERVARAGRQRVVRDGHDVASRMKQLIEWVDNVAKEKITTRMNT